jgi:hypothetical protein
LEQEAKKEVLKKKLFSLIIRCLSSLLEEERCGTYDFQKITELAIYQSIKKSDPDDQSQSQLLKLIPEEAMEIVI